MANQRTQARIEREWGQPIAAVLMTLYVMEELSEAQVAQRLGTSQQTVHDMMVRCGIPRRHVHYQYRAEDLKAHFAKGVPGDSPKSEGR